MVMEINCRLMECQQLLASGGSGNIKTSKALVATL